MKKYLLYYAFTVAQIAVIYGAGAQNSKAAKKWSIADCFQYAIVHNISISTLRLNELYAQQNLYLSKGAKLPGLSGTVGNSFNNANNNVTGNGNFVNQLNNTGVYSVNSSIVLWDGDYINNTIRQNNLLVQSAGLSVIQSANEITLSVCQAYLYILLEKENLKYIEGLVSTSEALVKQGQLFYDAGSVAKINLLQLQSQFASDKYLLVQTQNTIRQDILLLKQLLQLPTDTLFDIVIPLSLEVVEKLPSLQTVQQAAQQHFPEIEIGCLGIDIASLDIAKAREGLSPRSLPLPP